MGIEYELKFKSDRESQQAIREAYPGNWQTISMETTYYDTPGGDLSALHYTLRRRFENGVSVCTVKTPAAGAGRCEWEVSCDTIEGAIEKLCKLGAPEKLMTLTENGVLPVCGARFTRQALAVELTEGKVELALDEGVLFAGNREIPLCEIEVELKEGSAEAAKRFAGLLAEDYHLQQETKSKFRRANALREG